MNIVAREWRKILTALDETDKLGYDVVLEYSQALQDSHRNFLTIKATHDLDIKDSISFSIINRYVFRLYVQG